jgi:hypothetical protein
MQRIITYIAETFLVSILVYALVVAYKHRKKNSLTLITIYIIVSIIFYSLDILISIFDYGADAFFAAMYNSYGLFELCIINTFLFLKIKSKSFQFAVILGSCIYFSMCAIAWFINFHAFLKFTPFLPGIESIFIAIPSLLLIFEILKSGLAEDLRSNPVFLISSGLLFYHSLCVPIMFFLGYTQLINKIPDYYQYMIDITFIFYAVFIFTVVKAYLGQSLRTMY